MRRYGPNEYRYAHPIAHALETDSDFRRWFISRTRFEPHAGTARLLARDQKARRSANAENWWRSYFAGSAYPFKDECGERETDLLAIFEIEGGYRFALHIEVKAPGDDFGLLQAVDNGRRARCWAGEGRAPSTVLPHDDATTVLCSQRAFAERRRDEVAFFETVIAFENIEAWIEHFPDPQTV